MAVRILEVKKESCPSARLIGRKYGGPPDWAEWWKNDWFAVHIVDGMPERWIGMFFPPGSEVPEGFEAVDIEASDYAVCYLCDKEGSEDFYTIETHDMCLEELKAHGLARKEDDWCFERYNCPRFTTPDPQGNVILDYGISIR